MNFIDKNLRFHDDEMKEQCFDLIRQFEMKYIKTRFNYNDGTKLHLYEGEKCILLMWVANMNYYIYEYRLEFKNNGKNV